MSDSVGVRLVRLAAVLLYHFLPRVDLLQRQIALIVRDEEDAAQQAQVLRNWKANKIPWKQHDKAAVILTGKQRDKV